MNFLESVRMAAIWYIIIRCALDVVLLLLPDFHEMGKKFEFPINRFWSQTVFPVVALLAALSGYALAAGPSIQYLALTTIIPGAWAVVLCYHRKSAAMILDGVSWALVAIASILFNLPLFLGG